MNVTKLQTRGNCQCCGRDVAVVRGLVVPHGYKAARGWLEGTCPGYLHPPLQIDQTAVQETVETVRREVDHLERYAADLRAARELPATAAEGPWSFATRVPFDRAPAAQQQEAVARAIAETEKRAQAGAAFASQLERLAKEVDQQPLRTVWARQPARRVHFAAGRFGVLCATSKSYALRAPACSSSWAEVTCVRCRARRSALVEK